MGNRFEEYKKVFDPTNWPMDPKDLPMGIHIILAISGFIIAIVGFAIGVISLINDNQIFAIFPFVCAFGAIGSSVYQIRLMRSKR